MTIDSTQGLLLAGDIGATNTRLALYSAQSPHTPIHQAKFKGQQYTSFSEILREFLAGVEQPVLAASLGAAGPVIEGRVKLTNLPWTIDAHEIQETFGWQAVWLLNDLKAIASSVEHLPAADRHTLQTGQPEPAGSRFVIAPGTGLGVGYLVWDGQRYVAHATEAGHADFAPANSIQDDLLAYLRQHHAQVHVEHVCSGLGLPNIYDFLLATGRGQPAAWLAEQLASAPDRTPIIMDAALAAQPGSEICQQVLGIFVDVLAAESGSLALTYGSTGGVYLGGGIPPRILQSLTALGFAAKFAAKTGYENYLQRMPIQVILNTGSGLLGAAAYGWQQLGKLA